MAAIITNKFRIHNAEQFQESFSEAAATTYYLFIGRSHAWASDADVQGNTIAEGTDTSPPTPNDDITSEFYNYDDMIGLKLLSSSDVSFVIPRRDWATGTTYDMYRHDYSSSTIFSTSDGYRYKYMYSLTASEQINFKSTDFIHVSTDSTVSAAAVDGALDTILVTAGGSGFNTSSGSTISAIPIRGDGSGGVASVTITAGAISAATVTTAGTGYTFAYIRDADIIAATNAGGAGSGSNLTVIIPPKGGHGKDAVKELGGYYVMLNKSLVGLEGTSDITVSNDFRRIGLVRNPTNYGTSTVSTATTLRGTKVVLGASSSGTFTADEEINQASTGAVKKVVNLYVNLTAFSGANTITGQSSSATLTPSTSSSTVNGVALTSGYANPEVQPDSGDIIYVEQRSPITRAADQTENIKLIIEF